MEINTFYLDLDLDQIILKKKKRHNCFKGCVKYCFNYMLLASQRLPLKPLLLKQD